MTRLVALRPDQAEVRVVQEAWRVHADKAAALEAKGERHQWEAKGEYEAAAAEGASERMIAERVGKSGPHIHYLLTMVSRSEAEVEDLSFAEAYAKAKGGAHVGRNTGDNEWYTPAAYIAAAVAVMGGIDLDPASTAEANEVVGAVKFFAEKDNSLQQSWQGRVWLNPPYARPLIDNFCAKLTEEYAAGNVTQAITLTNNATETGWFHALAEVGAAICFPRHRVKFWHPGKESATPLQGQACVYFGEDIPAFRREFLQFGFLAVL